MWLKEEEDIMCSCASQRDREKSKPHRRRRRCRRRRITFKDHPPIAIPNIYETNRIEITTTTTERKMLRKKQPSFANRQNEMFVEWFLTYHLSFEFGWFDWLCVCAFVFVAFFSCFELCVGVVIAAFLISHLGTKNRYHMKLVCVSLSLSPNDAHPFLIYLFMFLLHVFFFCSILGSTNDYWDFCPSSPGSLVRSLFHKIIWDIQQAFVHLPTPSSCVHTNTQDGQN